MKAIRIEFEDNSNSELVIKRDSGGVVLIGIRQDGIYNNFAVAPGKYKDIQRAIEKVTKEATIS